MRTLVADEGGLAPDFPSVEAAFDDAVAAIREAGYEPGLDVVLCSDVAASHFFAAVAYHLGDDQRAQRRNGGRLADRSRRRVGRRPTQGGIHHPLRAPCQVESIVGDRSGDRLSRKHMAESMTIRDFPKRQAMRATGMGYSDP